RSGLTCAAVDALRSARSPKPRVWASKSKADQEPPEMQTMQSLICAGAMTLLAVAAFGQSGAAPTFDVADVHVSPKVPNTFMRISPPRNGCYEIRHSTIVGLVRSAYGFNPDTILGGANWLEYDLFYVIAKIAAGTDTDAQKAMLRSLLEVWFKLVSRTETKP